MGREAIKFLKENKAQGALEYLLIIGGAIVLAAIVIAIVVNVASKPKTDINTYSNQYDQTLADANKNLQK